MLVNIFAYPGMTMLDQTMATMTDNPFVNHVPVITGGTGRENVRNFYGTYFIPCQPPDSEIKSIARTIGTDRLVDELIHSFTHTVEMPWILPGVPPTGKHVELAVNVVVEFEDGKIAGERIYWDQASVLVDRADDRRTDVACPLAQYQTDAAGRRMYEYGVVRGDRIRSRHEITSRQPFQQAGGDDVIVN